MKDFKLENWRQHAIDYFTQLRGNGCTAIDQSIAESIAIQNVGIASRDVAAAWWMARAGELAKERSDAKEEARRWRHELCCVERERDAARQALACPP